MLIMVAMVSMMLLLMMMMMMKLKWEVTVVKLNPAFSLHL